MRSRKVLSAMAKDIAATRCLVKMLPGDYSVSRTEDAPVKFDLTKFVHRMAWLIEQAGSGRAAARSLGIAESTINNMIAADKGASFKTLRLLHTVTGVNLNWLVCYEGPCGDIRWPKTPAESVQKRTRPRRGDCGTHHTSTPKKRAYPYAPA